MAKGPYVSICSLCIESRLVAAGEQDPTDVCSFCGLSRRQRARRFLWKGRRRQPEGQAAICRSCLEIARHTLSSRAAGA